MMACNACSERGIDETGFNNWEYETRVMPGDYKCHKNTHGNPGDGAVFLIHWRKIQTRPVLLNISHLFDQMFSSQCHNTDHCFDP